MCDHTPVMKQYLEIKSKYHDAFLFFRMGDFYELFFEDAINISKLLLLTLTSRGKYKGEKIPMAGFPCHSLNNYLVKLVELGKKVAVCEQVGKAKKNGLMERKVVCYSTPGLLIDSSYLKAGKNNYISCVYCFNNIYSVSGLDLSTGHFFTRVIASESSFFDELDRVKPAEILISNTATYFPNNLKKCCIQKVNASEFDYKTSFSILKKFFGSKFFSCVDLLLYKSSIISAGFLLNYVLSFKLGKLENVTSIDFIGLSGILHIDANSRKNLELFKNLSGGEENTLLETIDLTVTPMGKRLLRRWLGLPLLSRDILNDRLIAVSVLRKNNYYLKLQEHLTKVLDLERILGRISNGSLRPIDLKRLQLSLEVIPQIRNVLKSLDSSKLMNIILSNIDSFNSLSKLIDLSIVDKPSAFLKEGCIIIKDGFDLYLDKCRSVLRNKGKCILECQENERIRTKIANLKVSFGTRLGHYIDLPNHINSLPSDYVKLKIMSKTTRYITAGTMAIEKKIQSVNNDLFLRESKIYRVIVYLARKMVSSIQNTAEHLSILDVINSFSRQSSIYSWCKPVLIDEFKIDISSGRHPVIENKIRGSFVSNDIYLDNNSKVFVITGANMGGKSTYMRQTAIIILLAHIGSYVPASSAIIGNVDKIFTRIGSGDDLVNSCSTFMLEMKEMSFILDQATDRSFVLIDEIGRGTGYLEGRALAWAILMEFIKKNSFVLFSTHFYDLSNISKSYSQVKNIYFKVLEVNDKLIFLYDFKNGVSNNSFAIHVAKMAGLPDDLLKNANEQLCRLKEHDSTDSNKILEFFNKIDLDSLSPKDALDKFYYFKSLFNKKD